MRTKLSIKMDEKSHKVTLQRSTESIITISEIPQIKMEIENKINAIKKQIAYHTEKLEDLEEHLKQLNDLEQSVSFQS